MNAQKITHNGITANNTSISSQWIYTTTPLNASNKVAYLIIEGFTANTHRQLYIEVESVAGNGEHKKIIKGFIVNFKNDNTLSSQIDSRYIEVVGLGGGARYGIGEVEKHSDTALKIPLIWISSTAVSQNKITVQAVTGGVLNLTFSIEYDATSSLTTENPYLYYQASEKWVKDNYDFRQYGLGTESVTRTGLIGDVNESGFYAFATNQQGFNFPRAFLTKRGSQVFGIVFQNSGNKVGFYTADGVIYTAWHTGNFNPAQYVLQSALNTQLANYATLAGTQTFTGQNTFTQAPYIPAGTLDGHAVNLGQLNTILSAYALASAIPTNNNQLTNGAGYITAAALGSYVLQTSLNTQLNNYATKAGTQTFIGTNTFTQAIYIPAATLSGHAVNLGQLNSIIDDFDFVTDEALNSYIKKGVNNVNPEGQPFSIHANYGSLYWNGNGFSFVTDSEQEFSYIEDEQAIGVNPFQDYGFYLNHQRLRFSNAGNSSELLPSNGVSKSKLPVTGSTQRTLAVGATMGGSTYYANENGLISLPDIAPPSVHTTVKAYMPGDVFNNDTVHCSAFKTIIYLSPSFAGPLHIDIEPDLQDGSELIVIHTYVGSGPGLFNINGEFISHGGQLISTYPASQQKTYRFIYVKDLERFALVDVGQM